MAVTGFQRRASGGRHEVDVRNRISIGRTTGAGDSLYNAGGNDALHFLPAILRHLYLIRPVSGRLCPSTVPLASIWPASRSPAELQPVPAVPAGGPGPGRPGTAGPGYKASPPGAPRRTPIPRRRPVPGHRRLVRSGSVKTYAVSEDGGEQVTGFHLSGELFGTDAINSGTRCCSAMVLERSSVCEIPSDRQRRSAPGPPSVMRQTVRIRNKEILRDKAHHANHQNNSPEGWRRFSPVDPNSTARTPSWRRKSII